MAVVVLAAVAFSATYLTVFTFGDPFSGTWKLNPDDPQMVVIKLTRAGYLLAVANGQTTTGWFSARRNGTMLTSGVSVLDNGALSTTRLVLQFRDGHLVETGNGNLTTLTKMSGSTSLPPYQTPAIGLPGG